SISRAPPETWRTKRAAWRCWLRSVARRLRRSTKASHDGPRPATCRCGALAARQSLLRVHAGPLQHALVAQRRALRALGEWDALAWPSDRQSRPLGGRAAGVAVGSTRPRRWLRRGWHQLPSRLRARAA